MMLSICAAFDWLTGLLVLGTTNHDDPGRISLNWKIQPKFYKCQLNRSAQCSSWVIFSYRASLGLFQIVRTFELRSRWGDEAFLTQWCRAHAAVRDSWPGFTEGNFKWDLRRRDAHGRPTPRWVGTQREPLAQDGFIIIYALNHLAKFSSSHT